MPKVTIQEDEKTGAIKITCSLIEDDSMTVVNDEEATIIQLPDKGDE
jgi:hypothetical protein